MNVLKNTNHKFNLIAQTVALSSLAITPITYGDAADWLNNSSAEVYVSSISNKETSIDKSFQTDKNEESFDALITEINFSTGYINKLVKLDVSALNVHNISSENPDSIYFVDGKGYGQVDGSLSIKPVEQLEFTTGRMRSAHVLLGTGDYRTTPRRYQLNRLAFQQGAVSLSVMEVAQALRIDGNSDYKAFTVKGKREPIRIVDVTLEHGDVTFFATRGKQTNKEAYNFAEIAYSPMVNDTVSFDIGINYRSKQRIGHASVSGQDNTLNRWAGKFQVNLENSLGQSNMMLAYAETEENPNMSDTVGFEWGLSDGHFRGCKNGGYYVTGHKGTFNHEGGRATKVELGHSFNGALEGLYTSIYFAKESNIYPSWQSKKYDAYDQRQYERGATIQYRPQFIPGLTAEAIYAKNRQLQSAEWGMNQHTARTQLTVSYSMPLEL